MCSVQYIVTAQKLDVTLPADFITAEQGSSSTLRCKFTVDGQTPATCEGVNIKWRKRRNDGTPYDEIWRVESERNIGVGSYATKLTGTSATLTTLNRYGHAVTFTSIEKDDEEEYWCHVDCFTGSRWAWGDSPRIRVIVNSKYILYYTSHNPHIIS